MTTPIGPTARGLAQFAAGALFVNAGLHSWKGLTGQRFPSPFTRPFGASLSSPSQNLAWGAINTGLGGVLLRRLPRTPGEALTIAVGGAAMTFALIRYFDGREFIDDTGAAR
jgi:hypothetical protein